MQISKNKIERQISFKRIFSNFFYPLSIIYESIISLISRVCIGFCRLLKRFLLLEEGDFFVEFLNAAEEELSKTIDGNKQQTHHIKRGKVVVVSYERHKRGIAG